MNGFIRLIIIGALVSSLLSCASSRSEDDEALTTQSYNDGESSSSGDAAADKGSGGKDDFADFDKKGDKAKSGAAATAPTGKDSDLALEDEVNQASPADKQFAADDLDKPAEMQPQAPAENVAQQPAPAERAASPGKAPEAPPVEDLAATTPSQPAAEPAAPTSSPQVSASTSGAVEITGLKYKANDAGGTVVIESKGPVTYTTRVNQDLKQFVIEIPNTILPKKLKRTLNTRDIKGAVGAVDAYQAAGSNVSRIVVQMREGFSEPVVQQEGNSLLVVTSPSSAGGANTAVAEKAGSAPAAAETAETAQAEAPQAETDSNGNVDLNSSKILASQSLEEYLSGNTKFYGRKISIETSNIDVRDALKFITEESGVNMVITDEVKGNISLKIRQVPWDQALIVIMKARKLGYSRQGSVLRIAPLDDLKKEEDDATKLALARKNVEPLKVRAFSISYAKVDELDKKVKDFLTERGKVVSDVRTNTIVVTDIEDNLNRVAKLIHGLDSAPPQVLIEGKIIEASDQFTRSVGVNWNFTGADVKVTDGPRGPVNMHPSLGVGAAIPGGGGLGLSLALGTLDILGDLTSTLALFEREEKVKVLSSPRIVTLTNEKADISTTNEYPVKVITTQAGGAPQISYQFKALTLKLEVTPQVTNDGTVIMKVAVMRQIAGAPLSTTDDTFSVNSREANTRVIVKNGQTAVIGGIYRTDSTDSATGVPWFKDIPGLGRLFKGTARNSSRSELLIFLTPRVLAQAETAGTFKSTGE